LSKIFGIGILYSKNLCSRVGINLMATNKDISTDVIKLLVKYINSECIIDRELRASIFSDVQNKVKLKTYQGRRHMHGLPVHGQNTKNNSKTAKALLKENAAKFKKGY